MEPKHEKYQRLIARCKALEPVACAVAHPCDESSLRGAVEAAQAGLIVPDPGRAGGARSKRRGRAARLDLTGCSSSSTRRTATPRPPRPSQLVARGQGRSADEGQPAHRRADGRGGQARDRAAHRAPHQPLLRHGRADLPQGADHHRRRDQHRARRSRTRSTSCQNAIDLAHALRRRRGRGSRSCRRWRRSTRRCRRRSTPRRCARWPTAARSRAALLDGPLAFDNAISPEAAQIKRHRLAGRRAMPTSCSCRISRPATCWPRA